MKTLLRLVFFGSLVLAGNVGAQYLSGSITGEVYPPDTFGAATSSSMTLFYTNIVQSATGDFAGIVPNNSLVSINPFYTQIDGLSTTPTMVSINNYLLFSQRDSFIGYQASGTTPSNRFEFNLETLAEDSYNSTTGQALFTGTGTIVDTIGAAAYQDTPADFTVTFTSARAYTFTVDAVPEPGIMSFAAIGLLSVSALRRRRA